MNIIHPKRRREVALLFLAGAVLTAGVLGGLLAQLHERDIADGKRLLTAVAQLTDEQTSRTLQNVEQGLQNADAIVSVAALAVVFPTATPGDVVPGAGSVDDELRKLAADRPYLYAIRVINAQGRSIHGSDTGNNGVDVSDRAYFIQHRDNPARGFTVGAPIRNRVTNNWIIPVTRGLRIPTGEFAGVILAGLDPMYFSRVWALGEEIPKLTMTLFRIDGTMLMRSPFDEALIGKSYSGRPVFEQMLSGWPAGAFQNTSGIDGERRLFAFRELTTYPGLVIVVGQAMDQVLAAWWRIVVIVVTGWAVAVLMMGALTAWLVRQWEVSGVVKARLLATIEAIPIEFMEFDRDDRLILINRAARLSQGWSVNPLGKTHRQLFEGSRVERRAQYPDQNWDSWIDKRLANFKQIGTYELTRPNGESGRFFTSDMPNGGQVLLRIDITESKQHEAKLAASQARYLLLFDANPYPAVVVSVETRRFLAVNDAAVQLYGWSREESLVMMIEDVYLPADLPGLMAMRAKDVPDVVRTIEGMRHRKKDGTIIDVEMSVRPIEFDGTPARLVIVQDVTKRHFVEAQLRQSQKMEAVGQLTGGIAHDFNNILTVILANTDALQEEENIDPAALHQRVEQISGAVLRAADLTRQLLAFSRKQSLHPKRTDLNDLVAATGKMLKRALGEHIEIESALTDGLWPVNIDRAQLETALVNLCVNARDAMHGGGTLLIETRNVTLDQYNITQASDVAPGDYVMLAVTDTGSGMPPEVRAKVFEPFFTTKDVGKGTGLGLSMVYGFIKQSAGHITIHSELGKGTTFRLYLPRSAGLHEELAVQQAAPLQRGSERILVVEDEPRVRASVVGQLESLGYRVEEAADGESGLAAVNTAAEPFDIVLTDLVMPGAVNGRALADTLASQWPRMKVVLMSGYADDVLRTGKSPSATPLLSKPFRKADLAKVIRQTLDATALSRSSIERR